MQIVIPMSGFGERFRRAGYQVPKPLIEMDGKPIIAHVIDMFPGEQDFLFICNNEHLQNPEYRLEAILKQYCPTGRIVGIERHNLGPIYAVLQVYDLIKQSESVLVNYCDFTCYWDWTHFKYFVEKTRCSGAIPSYKGFHPHTLGHTNYAYMREKAGWVQDIQEKKPYTDNRMEEYASSGSYYFANGKIMLDAFKETVKQDFNVGGEYYVSLAYKILLAAKASVAVYPLQHFMQWGTPEDVAEYLKWSSLFKRYVSNPQRPLVTNGSLVMPMAGLGMRFVKEGYNLTKPLIHVSGKSMVLQATSDLPDVNSRVFILRGDMKEFEEISSELKRAYPSALIIIAAQLTQGQACTALLGLEALANRVESDVGPLIIGACDNGALYNNEKLTLLLDNPDIDIIVWGVRGHTHAIRNPNMYGWIDATNGVISHISVKEPLLDTAHDPIVVGTFIFRRGTDFQRVVSSLIARNGRINNEFYIDSCIEDAISLGLRCHLFEVDHFVSWGTPNDLRSFEYWQSCFHKWSSHPYLLEIDERIPKEKVAELSFQYMATTPSCPTEYCYDET